ncbi:MAG: hypothetical protein VKJ46_05210 [Leptolyngbyaceae bacterium]|nr:hypothetical protein [Leptolyngbyaceae bacterium]
MNSAPTLSRHLEVIVSPAPNGRVPTGHLQALLTLICSQVEVYHPSHLSANIKEVEESGCLNLVIVIQTDLNPALKLSLLTELDRWWHQIKRSCDRLVLTVR